MSAAHRSCFPPRLLTFLVLPLVLAFGLNPAFAAPASNSKAKPKSVNIPVCINADGKIFVPSGATRCPKRATALTVEELIEQAEFEATEGEPGADGEDGEDGADGEDGEPGEDGSIRIYGDGSAGNLTVSQDQTLDAANTQYEDITIDSNLTVPSGAILRCSGKFVNRGTITVTPFAAGARRGELQSSEGSSSDFTPANAGLSHASAGSGETGSRTFDQDAGKAGQGLTVQESKQLLRPGASAGGGGGAGISDGAAGGGSLVVLCKEGIENLGSINAAGNSAQDGSGGGGGAGGIVILASPEAVTNDGSIDVKGGNGGSGAANSGAGGGGGGGLIHLLSPDVDADGGELDASGGDGSADPQVTVSATPRSGGGAGGSLSGTGGAGSRVPKGTSVIPEDAEDGSSGQVILTDADPTSLF